MKIFILIIFNLNYWLLARAFIGYYSIKSNPKYKSILNWDDSFEKYIEAKRQYEIERFTVKATIIISAIYINIFVMTRMY